ncbi:MAG: hypothetical protein H6581_03880 [Bacteroidia bacterium]|nr:hypothetical protein [Bacteroidia bacterium]
MKSRRINQLLLTLFLFCGSALQAQWTTYAPMPGTRWAHVCAAAGGKLYVLAGSVGPTYEYNQATDSWTVKASIPTLRSYPAVASWGGKIYVMGGSVGAAWSDLNECYDPVTDSWTTLAPMPTVRTTTAAAAVNGKVYVVNGWNGAAMTAVDVYDIATNTWSSAAPAPTPRSHAKTAVVANKIYLIGGYTSSFTGLVEVFDPALNTWATLAPLNTARYIHAVGEIGSTIYVAGGYTGSASSSAESYNVATNTWTVEPNLPTARYRTDGATLNACFYVLGGYNGSNLSTNEAICGTILPVDPELRGWKSGDLITLEWDRPMAGPEALDYVVERRNEFEEFERIGNLESTLAAGKNYLFHDKEPQDGVNYYRLVQVNQDGGINYSKVIEVEFSQTEDLFAYWNRAQSSLQLNWKGEFLHGRVDLDLLNMMGQQLASFTFQAAPGGDQEQMLPLNQPAAGSYLVRVRSERGTVVRRMVVE